MMYDGMVLPVVSIQKRPSKAFREQTTARTSLNAQRLLLLRPFGLELCLLSSTCLALYLFGLQLLQAIANPNF